MVAVPHRATSTAASHGKCMPHPGRAVFIFPRLLVLTQKLPPSRNFSRRYFRPNQSRFAVARSRWVVGGCRSLAVYDRTNCKHRTSLNHQTISKSTPHQHPLHTRILTVASRCVLTVVTSRGSRVRTEDWRRADQVVLTFAVYPGRGRTYVRGDSKVRILDGRARTGWREDSDSGAESAGEGRNAGRENLGAHERRKCGPGRANFAHTQVLDRSLVCVLVCRSHQSSKRSGRPDRSSARSISLSRSATKPRIFERVWC